MTRAERLARAAAATRENIAVKKERLASIASAQREETRKARDRRRAQLGALVQKAGLGGLDDATLTGLFALCQAITGSATPRATLQACQELVGGLRASQNGCAQAAPGVPPAVSVGEGVQLEY